MVTVEQGMKNIQSWQRELKQMCKTDLNEMSKTLKHELSLKLYPQNCGVLSELASLASEDQAIEATIKIGHVSISLPCEIVQYDTGLQANEESWYFSCESVGYDGKISRQSKGSEPREKGGEMQSKSSAVSDGSTASYYQLPEGAKELQDLISYRNMNSQLGEIFRACYRYGQASHSDQLRDAKKIAFYAAAEIERLEKYGNE